MPIFELICLANSRKYGGRCVAGLRTDGCGWVRLVSAEPKGVLRTGHYRLPTGRHAAVLDRVRVPVEAARPEAHQPENWLVAPGSWALMPPMPMDELAPLLSRFVAPGPAIFHGAEDRIPMAQVRKSPGAPSLTLVRPECLRWQVSQVGDKRQLRAAFHLCGAPYRLSLTDAVWEQRLEALKPGLHDCDDRYVPPGHEVLLMVSLGEPYEKDDCCYKLAAAVVIVPTGPGNR